MGARTCGVAVTERARQGNRRRATDREQVAGHAAGSASSPRPIVARLDGTDCFGEFTPLGPLCLWRENEIPFEMSDKLAARYRCNRQKPSSIACQLL